jgi:transposase
MARSTYPPHDFECLDRHSCPYLDGMSSQWVLEEYRRGEDVYQEHLRTIESFDGEIKVRDVRIRRLERENAELKAKLQALHRRQFKSNKKKDAERGKKDVEGGSLAREGIKKKRGAPVGHPGWVRPKPERIDQTVEVPAPTICPHCQSHDLTSMKEITEHLQEDIVIQPRTLVTRYLHGQAFCTKCHRPVVQAGEGELLNAPIGPVAKSVAIYLRYRIGIPYRKTTEMFRELFGLKFVPASALRFDRQAAGRGMPIYEDLRDKIRTSDVVHACMINSRPTAPRKGARPLISAMASCLSNANRGCMVCRGLRIEKCSSLWGGKPWSFSAIRSPANGAADVGRTPGSYGRYLFIFLSEQVILWFLYISYIHGVVKSEPMVLRFPFSLNIWSFKIPEPY